jgi:hypothetical protein
MTTEWRNRIIGEGDEAPDQLLANPANWRTHPGTQADALRGVLNEVGWVQRVIVNQRTGYLVPVVYVDLDEAEEALILATLDPLSALAGTDAAALDALLRDVSTGEASVQAMLAGLAEGAGLQPPDVEFREYDEGIENEVQYCECPNCGHKFPK